MTHVHVAPDLAVTVAGRGCGESFSAVGRIRLGEPERNVLAPFGEAERDLVRVALGLHHADRLVPRPAVRGSVRDVGGWRRSLDVEIAVENPPRWWAAASDLTEWLGVLTDDRWHVSFTEAPSRPVQDVVEPPAPPAGAAVASWSGGLDSVAGALVALAERPLVLVSSVTDRHLGALQRELEQRGTSSC
jgi:hypothetical protein